MIATHLSTDNTYQNVMEVLVNEEVERQLGKLPPKLARYIKKPEVITYALNRLPALYASSAEGVEHQRRRGRAELKPKITDAVRQGLVAVQVDPLRLSQPLQSPNSKDNQAILQMLRDLFQDPTLSWEEVPGKVKKLLAQQPAPEASEISHSIRHPGVYGRVPVRRRPVPHHETETNAVKRDVWMHDY